MVHYAMITSGIGLLWKWTLVADLITKQPAATSNIYFSKPRWTFRAQFFFSFSHFLELPDELSASCNYGRPLPYTSRTRHTLLTQQSEGRFLFHRRNRKGTNTACHNQACSSVTVTSSGSASWQSFHILYTQSAEERGSRKMPWRLPFRKKKNKTQLPNRFSLYKQITTHSENFILGQ